MPVLLASLMLPAAAGGSGAESLTPAAAGLSLTLDLGKDEAYPGQAVPLTVTLQVRGATVRNIGYPGLAAGNLTVAEFGPPARLDSAEGSGYRFTTTITPTRGGELVIGPARLSCEVMQPAAGSAAFFGGTEPSAVTIASQSVTLRVRPLPAEGRPASFNGAIGRFTMSVTTRPARVAIGDPLTVITTIRGDGALSPAGCPQIAGPGLRGYPPAIDRTPNQLTCEQVVVPATSTVPVVAWSFFDPPANGYQTLQESLTDAVQATDSIRETTRRPAWPAASPSLPSYPAGKVWAVIAVVAIGTVLFAIRRCRQQATTPYAPVSTFPRELLSEIDQAVAKRDVEIFYTILFRILQKVMTDEDSGASGHSHAIASPEECHRSVKDTATGEVLLHLFNRCNEARFSRRKPSAEQMQEDMALLLSFLASLNVGTT